MIHSPKASKISTQKSSLYNENSLSSKSSLGNLKSSFYSNTNSNKSVSKAPLTSSSFKKTKLKNSSMSIDSENSERIKIIKVDVSKKALSKNFNFLSF